MQNLRQLTFLELEQATCNFSQSAIIGEGRFGFVHKGLLQDGSIVAVKRCPHIQTRHFVNEVHLTFYRNNGNFCRRLVRLNLFDSAEVF